MTWRAFAALVGLVSVIVAGVAYMAYKYGAEAMLNMSTIARRGSVGARQDASRGGGSAGIADEADAGAATHGRWGDAALLLETATPGRASPPMLTSSLSLQYGATEFPAFNGSRAWEAAQGGGRNSLGASSPTVETLQRRPTAVGAGAGASSMRETPMQRVHSLPALHQSYSPAHGDRRGHREGWQALFARAGGGAAAVSGAGGVGDGGGGDGGVGGSADGLGTGRLERAVTAAVDGARPLGCSGGGSSNVSSSSGGDDDPLGCFNWSESEVCGQGDAGDKQVPPPPPPPLDPVPERVGSGGGANVGNINKNNSRSSSGGSGGGGSGVRVHNRYSPTSGASQAVAAKVGGTVDNQSPRSRSAASGNSVSASSGGGGVEDEDEDAPRGGRDASSATRTATSATAEATASAAAEAAAVAAAAAAAADLAVAVRGSKSSESDSRWRSKPRGHSRRGSRDMGSGSAALAMSDRRANRSDGDGDSRLDQEKEREREMGRDRRPSRSPRAPLCAAAEELVLDGGGGGDIAGAGGGDGADGAENTDALLVTNRRLRTEFVEGQKLGKGGFGTVFKCRNRLDGHDYAIKKIRLSSDRRWQPQLAKVLREVKIMSLLDHPNIVRYYQVRATEKGGGRGVGGVRRLGPGGAFEGD